MITPIDPSADKYPDSKAIILYDSVLIGGDSAMLQPNTYERAIATPDEVDYWEASFFAATDVYIDYVAVLVDGANGENVSVILNRQEAGEIELTLSVNNGIAMHIFDSPVLLSDGLAVATSSANGQEFIYVSAGTTLKMTQPIYGGHAPITLSSNTKYDSAKSVNGNFIGRTIERQGGETQFNWRNLDPYWYRSTFQPFVEHAKSKPFFIKWRPDYHGDEASYCWTTQDIKPQNQGGGTQLMSVNMSVECYDGV